MQKYPILGTIVDMTFWNVSYKEKIDSKRPPGKRRTLWIANLRTSFDESLVELFLSATNKTRISMMIVNILNGSAH